MSDAIRVEIENLKANTNKNESDIEKIHDRISDLRKECKEERDKMEGRFSTAVDGIKTDMKGYIKAGVKWMIGVAGVIIVGLLGIVGFFLNFVFQQILSKLP